MTEIRTATAFSGPFFERDPKETVRQNIRDMLVALAAEAQEDVQSRFPVKTGAGRAGVVGRVQSMTGKPWYLNAVVSEQHVYPWAGHRSTATAVEKRGAVFGGRRGMQGATIRSGNRLVVNSKNAQYRIGKLERKLHLFSRTASRIRGLRSVIAADLTRGLE